MTVAVTMPDLGESVEEATINRWLRSPGDHIEKDEPLLEVSTDKVDTEIAAPTSGVLTEILANDGDVFPVGADLAFIDEAPTASTQPGSESAPPPETNASAGDSVPAMTEPDSTAAAVSSPQTNRPAGPYVTPLVRRLATQLGIDLTAIEGSGVGNRIRKSDVLAAAATPAAAASPQPDTNPIEALTATEPTPYLSPLVQLKAAQQGADLTGIVGSGRNGRVRIADLVAADSVAVRSIAVTPPDRTEKLTRLRTVIAKRMVESLHISAQLTTVIEVDVTTLGRLRRQHGPGFAAATGAKLTYTSFFMRAAIDALSEFPRFNASIDTGNGTATYYGNIHLNVAVDTDRGLVAPVIRDANTLGINQLASATGDLAERARAGTLGVDDMVGGTFTITNTGSRGALFDTPIINQPQVAILGTGAVGDRAMVVPDEHGHQKIEVRSMAYLALTYDHRLIDGADAARFLAAIKDRLEGPSLHQEVTRFR